MKIPALKIIKLILLIAFVLNTLMLVLSVCAGWWNPKYFWPPALIKLFFFGWLGVHLVFLFAFILLRRKYFIFASLGILLFCLPAVVKLYAFHPFHSDKLPEKHFRIMTYNVMGFSWYDSKKDAFEILNNIRDQQPDVVCMQEYLSESSDKFNISDTLKNLYGYKYSQEHILITTGRGYYFGLAVYSKYPIKNFNRIPFDNSFSNGAFYTDLEVGNSTIRLINVHFQSFSLKKREYELDQLDEKKMKVTRFKMLKVTLHKLRGAFRKKSFQTGQVEKAIAASPYPVILCGDFNDTPLSYTYARMTDNLEDTYLKTNFGIGLTYAGNLPYLRIDYILADKGLKPIKTFVVNKKASDHYPLVCDFEMP